MLATGAVAIGDVLAFTADELAFTADEQ